MKCICRVCEKEFDRRPALIKRAKNPVCSRKCADILKYREWVEIKCCICNKPILRRKSRLEIRKNPICSKECRKILLHRLFYDKTISEEQRETDRNYRPENRIFINSVLERDNYTCKICNRKSIELQVHHLNGYNWDIENRYNINNGITLCKECHKDFHKQYGRGNNTKEQFIEYANQSGSLGIIS